ncbi:helix-turn-helix domain-containing protein [Jatrophihabitans sp.]|uniref:winged helix-turn-helix transcriptional regulator n=1 Tax=Jatrophihabitans sp. TaxID=1932789 RepID=UPI0030C6BFDE|nr:hxlR-like helix-turn-helix family protein [Jatrophihabitans sp.]
MVDSRTCTRHKPDPEVRDTISDMLARIGDKWSLLIVSTLGERPLRFNELRRQVDDISQKMLSSTLKVLERDGLVSRSVLPSVPPQVEYALTDLGRELLRPVAALAEWTAANTARIVAARAEYDARVTPAATG